MKKVVAFILCFLIFIAPITTFVKANVVIGDNDDTIINENATILGRKIALMESLSDLALSGVTEFTISNSNDVDSYLDNLWEELDDAIESLSNGTGFAEISNSLKSKYFTNLVQYQDYINNRGNYFAQLLPSGNPTTTLLSTFFADNVFGKHSTIQNNLSLDAFRALSRFNNSVQPTPDPDYSYISNINNIYITNYKLSELNTQIYTYQNPNYYTFAKGDYTKQSFIGLNFNLLHVPNTLAPTERDNLFCLNGICTIQIYHTNGANVHVTYSTSAPYQNGLIPYNYCGFYPSSVTSDNIIYSTNLRNARDITPYNTSSFSTLNNALSYIYQHYTNINLYVNDVPWVIISDTPSNPTLDIDGFLKLYGNDNPTQYNLQPITKIDYDQLYQVIYHAIRDNLPISQGDINYYDSHDTIYSPTIINNYGEEEGDELDLIDTILDYAVIPKFDTAIAQPMRQALTNGVVIMNNSITNVIPNEILLILGACFFLLLFAVVINRMIK